MGEAEARNAGTDLPRRAGPERDAIIAAAAECFMEAGFTDTSIDDVAVRLNATKGKIYHYYRSKTDLFFDVHRYAMAINLHAIEPVSKGQGCALERLKAMCRLHLKNILEHMSYQRVLMQGVEMHLSGATTPAQRKMLKLLMNERERYEELFRDVLLEGRQAGMLSFETPSFASKAVLAVLNNPVIWYRKRENATEEEIESIVKEFTIFAMRSVGADTDLHGRKHDE